MTDRIVEIERLASLDPIDYEVARGEAAGRIGIRTQVLDGLVKKKRRELGLETASDDVGQGRAVKIEDILASGPLRPTRDLSQKAQKRCLAAALGR